MNQKSTEDRLDLIEAQLKYIIDQQLNLHNTILTKYFETFNKCFVYFNEQVKELKSISEKIRDESIVGTMAFMAKQIHGMQNDILDMKDKGIKKNIHLDLTLDGYEMVKKIPKDHGSEFVENEKCIEDLLQALSAVERSVLCHRFGLMNHKQKTSVATGNILKKTKQYISVIEARALRKCRHPSRRHFVEKITHKELRTAILGE